MFVAGEQTAAMSQLEQWHTLLHRAAGNAEEVAPIGLR
jgi:hypothetical protein